MKIPLIIYAEALGIYLVLTLSTIAEPAVYFISAWYALASSLAAMLVFSVVFLLLQTINISLPVKKAILFITVLAAVATAYKLLLVVEMPDRSFFKIDGYIVFPIVAVASGWLALAINLKRVSEHFVPPLEEWETLFTYQHEKA